MNISDVPGLVAKMRDHRFDGHTDTGVAAEIEKFRGGDGIGSIGTAVEALKAVTGALAETRCGESSASSASNGTAKRVVWPVRCSPNRLVSRVTPRTRSTSPRR